MAEWIHTREMSASLSSLCANFEEKHLRATLVTTTNLRMIAAVHTLNLNTVDRNWVETDKINQERKAAEKINFILSPSDRSACLQDLQPRLAMERR